MFDFAHCLNLSIPSSQAFIRVNSSTCDPFKKKQEDCVWSKHSESMTQILRNGENAFVITRVYG